MTTFQSAAMPVPPLRRIHWGALALAVVAAGAIFTVIAGEGRRPVLFAIGLALGFSLYHSSFSFTGAYRRVFTDRDMTGVVAQLLMLALAMLLFAPILAQGQAFGRGVGGALAPVSVSVGIGAFLFGMGMQIAGACASGTLFTVGGRSPRMIIVLIFFSLGTFWGSLDLAWWGQLPGLGVVSLGDWLGWEIALPLQLGLLGGIYLLLRSFGCRVRLSLWSRDEKGIWRYLFGVWPLLAGAMALALLNWATLLTAGHPWSITWAFTLWGAKMARFAGWDPASSGFWSGGFQEAALNGSLLADTTSLMSIGIIIGALFASALAGRRGSRLALRPAPMLTAIIGGLMMGYGARLAYGCNIGAFFSGVASGSLHGWLWIAAAFPGAYVGLRLRRLLRLGD